MAMRLRYGRYDTIGGSDPVRRNSLLQNENNRRRDGMCVIWWMIGRLREEGTRRKCWFHPCIYISGELDSFGVARDTALYSKRIRSFYTRRHMKSLKFCPFLSNHIFPVVLNGILPTRSTSFNI
jgi:hypothetical protein